MTLRLYCNTVVFIEIANVNLFRQAMHAHGAVDETADGAREMLQELIQTLDDADLNTETVTMLLETLPKSIARVS